jgi:hypothetical protein
VIGVKYREIASGRTMRRWPRSCSITTEEQREVGALIGLRLIVPADMGENWD